jgi:isoleucyl-tRNA synthetase
VEVRVAKAPGEKCQRCWNFSQHVGTSKKYPLFCKRCEEVVESLNL